jgi:hypothetical protein
MGLITEAQQVSLIQELGAGSPGVAYDLYAASADASSEASNGQPVTLQIFRNGEIDELGGSPRSLLLHVLSNGEVSATIPMDTRSGSTSTTLDGVTVEIGPDGTILDRTQSLPVADVTVTKATSAVQTSASLDPLGAAPAAATGPEINCYYTIYTPSVIHYIVFAVQTTDTILCDTAGGAYVDTIFLFWYPSTGSGYVSKLESGTLTLSPYGFYADNSTTKICTPIYPNGWDWWGRQEAIVTYPLFAPMTSQHDSPFALLPCSPVAS